MSDRRLKLMLFLPPVLVLLLVFALLAWGQTDTPGSATAPSRSGVTTQRLEDYIRAHQREHELLERQVVDHRAVIDQRLEGMNDLRRQIESERGAYQPRGVADVTRENTEVRLRKLEQDMASLSGSVRTWIFVVGVLFTIIQIGLNIRGKRAGDRRPG